MFKPTNCKYTYMTGRAQPPGCSAQLPHRRSVGRWVLPVLHLRPPACSSWQHCCPATALLLTVVLGAPLMVGQMLTPEPTLWYGVSGLYM